MTLQKLPDGTEVLHFQEDLSKTNKGGLRDHHIRPKSLNVYPANEEMKCLVYLFKKFTKLRPTNDTSGAFFLRDHLKYSEKVWFLNSPIGHNTLANTIRNLMESAGEDSAQYSNHSGRRTAVCRIMEATGSKELAKKVTGHRSDCVTAYNEMPEKLMKPTSQVLTNSMTNIEISQTESEVVLSTPKTTKMEVEIDGENKRIRIIFS